MTDTKNQGPLSWLALGDVETPAPEAAAVFDASRERLGYVRHMHRLLGNAPEVLAPLAALSRALLYSERCGLSLRERELIAVVVSAENKCVPCIFGHAAGLRSASQDAAWVGAVEANYRHAELTPRERALADYAARLTLQPEAMLPADVEPLRAHGLSELDILFVAAITSYFNFTNRFNSGLGVHANVEDFAAFR